MIRKTLAGLIAATVIAFSLTGCTDEPEDCDDGRYEQRTTLVAGTVGGGGARPPAPRPPAPRPAAPRPAKPVKPAQPDTGSTSGGSIGGDTSKPYRPHHDDDCD